MIRKVFIMLAQPAKKTTRRVKQTQISAPQDYLWREYLIQQTAYYFYESRGREPGHDLEDWLLAESIVAQQQQPLKMP